MKIIDGSLTAAKGFTAAGEHIGVKKVKKDLALIHTEKKAVCAACFTQNKVKAASVLWNQKIYKNDIYGVAVVSGNANACTGQKGIEDNYAIAAEYGKALGASAENILVCSTGVIGVNLPIEKILPGIKETAGKLGSGAMDGQNAAEAICTTDTFKKTIAVEIEIGGKKVIVSGAAKGSGMIHPNMATLLSFITTDVCITRELLQKALDKSVALSYNMISVDGDTSTNDTLLVLANGASGCPEICEEGEEYKKFIEALDFVNSKLAKDIVRDGEGATKFIEVNVCGAASETDARLLARSVTTSNLVKTMLFGCDANWGRVLAAMGYSGASFNTENVTLKFSSASGEMLLLDKGVSVLMDEEKAKKLLIEKDITISITLEDGESSATAWGCDLSYEYVKINGEYRS